MALLASKLLEQIVKEQVYYRCIFVYFTCKFKTYVSHVFVISWGTRQTSKGI